MRLHKAITINNHRQIKIIRHLDSNPPDNNKRMAAVALRSRDQRSTNLTLGTTWPTAAATTNRTKWYN